MTFIILDQLILTTPLVTLQSTVFGKSVKDRRLEYIARVVSKHPKVIMGKYGITGEQFLEVYNQEGFDRKV